MYVPVCKTNSTKWFEASSIGQEAYANLYSVRNLSAQTALTEAFNEQSCNWLVNDYAVEEEERLCVQTYNTLYVCYWWRFADSALRWEQLYARKGNSLTLSPSC